ncbi:hypothetical protein M406DRAFT_68116 [Cryphonectria parasitica EP155]|uniref:Cyanovirin-N domain-containing protein n=1 Tax=Cryphonectria parasitica (strain ATCC 38755 / EP155) TaxID=660469 RepID=A0A9P5CQ63_CRYP1|nr:uncharacterized protein M406DRAFT_68116 [Cryphonectria parasitica EP155]KAF3765695.1 hypothetical protein M406DRAFT_68116 [Cryphonectria parasitica EP155]
MMFNHNLVSKVFAPMAALLASVTATDAPLPMATGFSSYCDPTSIGFYDSAQTQLTAMCSAAGGAGVLYESYLDLNLCFVNVKGSLYLRMNGGALHSCTCEMGDQITSCQFHCGITQAECSCHNGHGNIVNNPFDFNSYIGLADDGEGHVVLSCQDAGTIAVGTFTRCVDLGDTVDCP